MQKGELIGQGRTAEVFAWGEDRILKLYQRWMPREAVEREHRVTRAAQAAGVPVPSAEELIEVEDRFGIVFERVVGASMLKELETNPWAMPAIAHRLVELHARIHACVAPPGLPSTKKQVEDGITASILPDDKKEAARRYLAGLPDGDALCHGDFHPDNILISDHGPVIIDWMTGSRGDPLADVARTRILLLTGGLPPQASPFTRMVINAMRSSLYSRYLKEYLRLRSAQRSQVNAWELPLTAARLREVEGYPAEKTILLSRLDKLLSR